MIRKAGKDSGKHELITGVRKMNTRTVFTLTIIVSYIGILAIGSVFFKFNIDFAAGYIIGIIAANYFMPDRG